MPQASGGNAGNGRKQLPASSKAYQVPATAANSRQFLVALGMMIAIGAVLIAIAGTSRNAGRFVVGLLSIMLLVQLITKVSPFAAWIAEHPFIPTQ